MDSGQSSSGKTEASPAQIQRDRLLKVFEFLKAYSDLRYPPVRKITEQMRILWLGTLPDHPSIEIASGTPSKDEATEDDDVVLRITRPTLKPCPRPPAMIAEWLKRGWENIDGTAEVNPTRNVTVEGRTRIEKFDDQSSRRSSLASWRQERVEWQKNERPARDAMGVFQTIYEWYGIHEREAERVELLLADGLLSCPDGLQDVNHPVLFQKLALEFYPEKRDPQFVFRKREQPPELYLELLRVVPEVNLRELARCADELKKTEFSPLAGDDTTAFLRRLIQGIFPDGGHFVQAGDPGNGTNPQIERKPVIFMRQRRSGVANIFDLVREDIATRTDFSTALLQIVGIAEHQQVVEPGGSSHAGGDAEEVEILLSKPANKEQFDIARQLARRDCVLVQGPPGTGKTHTIANLLGHLLAQGKRVLVTAHTPKALRVLRQKVVEPLQPLCISVLQNDKQSQEDLQQSVRQIAVKLSQDIHLLEQECPAFHVLCHCARPRRQCREALAGSIVRSAYFRSWIQIPVLLADAASRLPVDTTYPRRGEAAPIYIYYYNIWRWDCLFSAVLPIPL